MHVRSGLRESNVILGAETVILSLIKGLSKEKFNPIVVCFSGTHTNDIPLLQALQRENILTDVVYLRNRYDISAIFKLRKLIKKYNVDILHCHEYKSDIIGFFASVFIQVKRVTTVHGWTKANLKVSFYEWLDSIVVRFYDKIVTVSEDIRRQLIAKKIPETEISVIHNSIDIDMFSSPNKTNLRQEFNIPKEFKIVGTVGRLSKEKGQNYFLKAAAEIIKEYSDVKFIIVGDGSLMSKLKGFARQLGIDNNVIFTGYRKNISSIMSEIDLFVLSSLREGLPMVILEAMVQSKPIVSFKIGGVPEAIVDGQTGILVQPKDYKTLAQRVIKLLKDPDEAKRIGEAALEQVINKFSVKQMVQKYEKNYKELSK